MKKKFLASLATGMFVLGLGGMAQALTINDGGTEVGGIDELINQTKLDDSGEATELAWITGILGAGWTLDAKYDTTDGDGWFTVDGLESVFAHALETAPTHFVIKTGANSGNTNTHFLFENVFSLDWGVIDLAEMGFSTNNLTEIDKISYISEYNGENGNGAPVPEPMTMLLMGTGLAGLVGIRRKMKF